MLFLLSRVRITLLKLDVGNWDGGATAGALMTRLLMYHLQRGIIF